MTLKSTLLTFCTLLCLSTLLPAQRKGALAQPHQLLPIGKEGPSPTAANLRQRDPNTPAPQRTTTVNGIQLGSTCNAYSTGMTENNCVAANNATGALVFVHRSDTVSLGGSAFSFRYDISTDRGATWTSNIGPVNTTNLASRYPQVALHNPSGNTAPLGSEVIWTGEHLSSSIWAGFTSGAASMVTSGTPALQEMILPTGPQSVGGGLAEGLPGEFWMARLSTNGTDITDSLKIYKGVYDAFTQSISWSYHTMKTMNWSITGMGTPNALAPSVAFSPDGMTGWIATLGDLDTAADSIFAPILLKSTDGGATWGTPAELDLNSFAWVADSLKALWVDSLGAPSSTGRATAAFDYDLTVDANGNPHMFFVIASATAVNNPVPSYSLLSGLAKYAVDLTSANQGTSYDLRLVAPVLTFRSQQFGIGTPVTQDNYPQVSRTADGQYIFYSWVDSDTAMVTGSQLGVGFGNSDNSLPNIWYSGLRVADGYFSCIQALTQADLVWEGRAFQPQLASEVVMTGSGSNAVYYLPIVNTEMPNLEPSETCNTYYFGNDATLMESDFSFAPGSTVTWLGCGVNPGIAAYLRGKMYVDFNANGTFDGTDIAVPGQAVVTTGTLNAGVTNGTGDYSIRCAPNLTYGIQPPVLNSAIWSPVLPAAPYSVTPAPMAILTGYDFTYQPLVSGNDLAISIVIPSMRPGFVTEGVIYVTNLGTMPASGTLTFGYDPVVGLTSAVPTWATNNTSTYTATWTLPTIPVFGTHQVHVYLAIPPTVPLNTSLAFSGNVATNGSDIDGYNNVDATNVITIGSYDPNDKAASPAGVGTNHQVAPGTELSYRIRFQNTGTASAINVVVRDTLDTDLDISTFKMLGSSHNHVLSVENGRFLTWDFSNIQLPDSFSNEPGSHGHIDYSIRPKANLPLGTVVDNDAAIYFDFNAPVLTNVASITYDIPAAVNPGVTASGSLRIYPHPVGSRATVEFQRHAGKTWSFELFDLQGRVIHRADAIAADSYEFDRGSIPAGAYVYKVTAAGHVPNVGRLILD